MGSFRSAGEFRTEQIRPVAKISKRIPKFFEIQTRLVSSKIGPPEMLY
jgi:hypothetical protein